MLDCIVFCDMLVALVALCHLFERNSERQVLVFERKCYRKRGADIIVAQCNK